MRRRASPPAPPPSGRRRAPTRALPAIVWLLTLGACVVQVPERGTAFETMPPGAAIEEFIDLAHAARRDAGCPDLVLDATTVAVAQAHSEDMLRRDYVSHTTPEGATLADRLRSAGITYSAAAENIAAGAPTGEAAFRQWMGSRGHRNNLLDCRYTRHGVGMTGGIWTHVLWRP